MLLRRAAGIVGRSAGGELHSVYVARPGPAGPTGPAGLVLLRGLTEDLGGTHHTLAAADPAQAVLDLARGIDATQVVVAATQVFRDGEEVRLTPTEWRLLAALVTRPGRLVSQRQLLNEGWGPGYPVETNYLRVYVAGLRRKLEADPSRLRHLVTEPGMGYRFVP